MKKKPNPINEFLMGKRNMRRNSELNGTMMMVLPDISIHKCEIKQADISNLLTVHQKKKKKTILNKLFLKS